MKRARDGDAIPAGWALDESGQSTEDPAAALKGTMLPSGGYKGFSAGLLVEVMAAALAGASLELEASPFSGTQGGPQDWAGFYCDWRAGRGTFARITENCKPASDRS